MGQAVLSDPVTRNRDGVPDIVRLRALILRKRKLDIIGQAFGGGFVTVWDAILANRKSQLAILEGNQTSGL